jgi:hypothetical protein
VRSPAGHQDILDLFMESLRLLSEALGARVQRLGVPGR